MSSQNGWTALHHAAKAGHLDVVTLLVEAGASPNHETKEDKVAICYAASANHAEVLSYLMKKDHDTQHLMDNDKVGRVIYYVRPLSIIRSTRYY